MMVGTDAIGAKNQESTCEHETEHNPHSLINDRVNQELKVPLGDLHSTLEIQ
jgi:hypothetical protein